MIPERQAAMQKSLGIKADKNWEEAEVRQRPSNKAFGPVFPGGTGPRPSKISSQGGRGSGVYYGHGGKGTEKSGPYKMHESRA